jgi:hypothetical protein
MLKMEESRRGLPSYQPYIEQLTEKGSKPNIMEIRNSIPGTVIPENNRRRACSLQNLRATAKAIVVYPKDTTRSLARTLVMQHCRREKYCAQLFEYWLPISETGSGDADRIYHRRSIATCAKRAKAL